MVVNNYYYSNPSQNMHNAKSDPVINNYTRQDAVSNQKVQSPEDTKTKDLAAAAEEQRMAQQAAQAKQVELQKAAQATEQKTEDSSQITGLGSNINVLA